MDQKRVSHLLSYPTATKVRAPKDRGEEVRVTDKEHPFYGKRCYKFAIWIQGEVVLLLTPATQKSCHMTWIHWANCERVYSQKQ